MRILPICLPRPSAVSYLEVIDMVISLKDVPDLFEAEFAELSGGEVFDEEVAG